MGLFEACTALRLRGAFAFERWRAGVDMLILSKLMAHESLQVLNRDLKQISENLEQAAQQSSPVDSTS